jgi:hypothetical protein
MISVIISSVIMLSVNKLFHCVECQYLQCHFTECHYAEYCNAESHNSSSSEFSQLSRLCLLSLC